MDSLFHVNLSEGSKFILNALVAGHQIVVGARHVFGKLRSLDVYLRHGIQVGVGADPLDAQSRCVHRWSPQHPIGSE